MKTKLSRACLFLLGITLAVGCGPAAPEDMQEQDSFESPTPQTVIDEAPNGAGDQVSQDETMEEDGIVGEASACCYVKCSGDTAYKGPFKNVKYGNCNEYGHYYCGQRGRRYSAAKWDNC